MVRDMTQTTESRQPSGRGICFPESIIRPDEDSCRRLAVAGTGVGLQRKAEDLGAEGFVMSGLEPVDVARVARKAVAT
jgi:hypothetical protein